MAESAGISMEAMKLEVNKAFKRRMAIQKKKKEREDLAPAKALQPKERSIRYENMKSAMAEEGILAQICREPALLEECKELKGGDFSVPLLEAEGLISGTESQYGLFVATTTRPPLLKLQKCTKRKS